MEYHIERGLRLNQKPEHSRLYQWAVNEIDETGQQIGSDYIPWPWSFVFVARSCELVARCEIKTVGLMAMPLNAPEVNDSRAIQAKLRPSVFDDEDDSRRTRTRFSMFGTSRVIEEFGLRILPLSGQEPESCTAWGCVSYTAEMDFRDQTEPDMIIFTIMVRPETFARYAALIAQGTVSRLSLRVHSVHGFYSNWSPSISTSAVKVLARSNDQSVEPQVDGIAPPRLGEIGEAEVSFTRRIVFEKHPTPDSYDQVDDAPLIEGQPAASTIADPRLLNALLALKRVVWIGVAMLAAHLLMTLGR